LTKPVHWARNIGRLVNVAGDAINATGRITAFSDPDVTLDIGGKLRTVNIAGISRAHIEVEFKKMPKAADLDDAGIDSDSEAEMDV
jgi:ribosome maturation factor RimP